MTEQIYVKSKITLCDKNGERLASLVHAIEPQYRVSIANTAHTIRSGVRLLKMMEMDAACAEIGQCNDVSDENLITQTVTLQELPHQLNRDAKQWIRRISRI